MSIDSASWLDKLAKNLVPVPCGGEDVCSMCRSWKFPSEQICNNCLQVTNELALPCSNLMPISLYRKPSQLRDWLKFYKPNTEGFIPGYGVAISAILDKTLVQQSNRLVEKAGHWDHMVVVPSTRPSGSHPLEHQLKEVGLEGQLARPLIRTQAPLGHRVMSDDGYAVTNNVAGKRFLLVDDVYTTGARSQSAASALQLAGGLVVAIVVIGRRINVEYNEYAERVWNRQQDQEFNFETVFSDLAGRD